MVDSARWARPTHPVRTHAWPSTERELLRRQSWLTAREEFHDPPLENLTRQHDAVTTPDAAEADIGAEPHHGPLVGTTSMGPSETHHVAEAQIQCHSQSPRLADQRSGAIDGIA